MPEAKYMLMRTTSVTLGAEAMPWETLEEVMDAAYTYMLDCRVTPEKAREALNTYLIKGHPLLLSTPSGKPLLIWISADFSEINRGEMILINERRTNDE